MQSIECKMQWPAKSERWITFPEIDRVEFFGLDDARAKMNPAQGAFLDALSKHIG